VISIIAIYALLLVLAVVLVKLIQSTKSDTETGQIQPVAFIIPFKNEAERIHLLIQSFNKSNWHSGFEVIFVDDHSIDNSIDILLADLDIPYRILKLKETSGKKAAILYGISNTAHEQIHTLDADIAFKADFLISIGQLPKTDLTILPVTLSGNSVFQNLNKIEFQWLQTFTFSLAKLNRLVLCNGANLSFSKTTFLETLPQRSDFSKASGDDMYLLQAIKQNKGNVASNISPNLVVQTHAPNNFKNLISQRKRWIKKVMTGPPAIILLILYIFYHVLPFYGLFNLSNDVLWILPLLLKIIAEWILSRQYSIKQLVTVIFHQVYYPIYGFMLLLSLPFKTKWK